MAKKVILAILDGWGLTKTPEVCAITEANTPFMDSCYQNFPHTQLKASGLAVGLPEGQIGNSEVGHMNLGAGRVVYQNLTRLNLAVEKGVLGKEKALQEAFLYAQENQKNVHLLGLLSDGGVHSHINHLKALLDEAHSLNLDNIFIHAFTDGRDCDPKKGKNFVEEIQKYTQKTTGKLASVIGRFYAMDRDERWERVKKSYELLVKGEGTKTKNTVEEIEKSYEKGVFDEFIEPIVVVDEQEKPITTIKEGDVVVFYNFRTDRGRELTKALHQQDFPDFEMKKLDLYFVTMSNYDRSFENIKVVFDEETIDETLGEVLEKAGKSQIRIAETEKYPHVTFFFSGGREVEFKGEKRILCPSPREVKTYDLKPEMAAYDIKNAIIPELKNQTADFICLNFANPDMVGHTGVFEAAVKACEVVDECIKEVATTAYENGYVVMILADHGNSDFMKNEDGSPNTNHTTNLVPLIVMDKGKEWTLKEGKLGDIAPSILHIMGIEIPEKMTGEVVVS
ncbi:MAG: 2,3-bisphosphoglycerate-independent phosphoglycerate mutase [Flavobacteriaceae bacterium]|nr:2,3-bisphosphoglycerate-independent phosphoglycerate mutase [Flavobacteriaceae bacterium]